MPVKVVSSRLQGRAMLNFSLTPKSILMKKVLFGLSLLALTTAAFANNRNDAKTESPATSETKAQAYSNVYYVTSFDGTNYHLSPTQPPGENCLGGSEPCRITTKDVQGDLQITPAELSTPSIATIEDTKDPD